MPLGLFISESGIYLSQSVKSSRQLLAPLARTKILNLDFATLLAINREVVSLTAEKHEHNDADDVRLQRLVEEAATSFNDEDLETALVHKASLLAFRIATGQHFHEGNKRTALVAASGFLKMNHRTIDIRDPGLVSVIDKAGVGNATLNEVIGVMERLTHSE